VVETKLRLNLIKKADKYWWLWYCVDSPTQGLIALSRSSVAYSRLYAPHRDGDKESSAVPFPDSYFRLDPGKITTIASRLAEPASPPTTNSKPAALHPPRPRGGA
jgi:hypothetical protein